MNSSNTFGSLFRFSENDTEIGAECKSCGRVLKIPKSKLKDAGSSYSISSPVRCPCGRTYSHIAGRPPSSKSVKSEDTLLGANESQPGMSSSEALRAALQDVRRMETDPSYARQEYQEMMHGSLTDWDMKELKRIEAECRSGALDCHGKSNYGNSMLHFPRTGVLHASTKAILELYLRLGLNVDARNDDGETPLHKAVVSLAPHYVLWLLQKGADPNARDNRGRTPVLNLSISGFNSGLYKDELDSSRYTPPPQRGHIPELLLKYGGDVSACDNDGNTALHLAADNSYPELELVQWLLAKGADVNALNNSGETPLYRTPETFQFTSNQYIHTGKNPVYEFLKSNGGRVRPKRLGPFNLK